MLRGRVYWSGGFGTPLTRCLRVKLAPEQIKEYLQKGARYLNDGDTVAGRKVYEELIAFEPRFANAYVGLGQSYEFENNISQALACYKKAIELAPENRFAHIACAGAYLMRGDYLTGFAEYEWRWKNSNMEHLPAKWDDLILGEKRFYYLVRMRSVTLFSFFVLHAH